METTQNLSHGQCIFSTVSAKVIDDAMSHEGNGSFVARGPWNEASKQLEQASGTDEIYLLLLSESRTKKRIRWVAKIDKIEPLVGQEARVIFSGFHPLEKAQSTSALTQFNTELSLGNSDDTPCCLCMTPDFAEEDTKQIMEAASDQDIIDILKEEMQARVTEAQRRMLVGLYMAPGMRLSIGRLAVLAGFSGTGTTLTGSDAIATQVAEAMKFTVPEVDGPDTLAAWQPGGDGHEHGQWVLFDEIADALEELGWVKPKMRRPLFANQSNGNAASKGEANSARQKTTKATNVYACPTLVMNIERRFFSQIVAQPPTKLIEYRENSPYWQRRLQKVGPAPFNLRLLNGMINPIPEATIRVTKVIENRNANELEFHLGEIIEVKHWDRKAGHPI